MTLVEWLIVAGVLAPFMVMIIWVIAAPIYYAKHPPEPIVFPPPRYRLADNVKVPIEDVIRAAEKDAVEGNDDFEVKMQWVWM